MNNSELIAKIISKREFSQLPEKDVQLAFSHFEKRQTSDEEKIRLTRELLHKVFGAFASRKLLSLKNKDEEWILRKHLSTRERLSHYKEIYRRILRSFNQFSVIDLGAGINGLSYKFFEKKADYTAIESVGQLVGLMNHYFKKNNLQRRARAYHESLFNLEGIKKVISETEKPRIIFLFKVLDSLEMIEKDYSKKLILEIAPLADRIAVSFATRSMEKRRRFRAKRYWIINFLNENFNVIEDFEFGGERYIVFKPK